MKRLGILGGMGPEAAIDLQLKILRRTSAQRDRDHLPVVTWNIPQIPDRTAAILGQALSPLPAMTDGVMALERLGAQIIVIACNTAHHWHSELQSTVSIPILHIVDACHDQIAQQHSVVQRLGLLATDGTRHSGFYQRRLAAFGIELVMPSESDQRAIGQAIGQIKSGHHETAARWVAPIAENLCERGAERIILGCTELPLVVERLSVADRCVDATDALARQAVHACQSTN